MLQIGIFSLQGYLAEFTRNKIFPKIHEQNMDKFFSPQKGMIICPTWCGHGSVFTYDDTSGSWIEYNIQTWKACSWKRVTLSSPPVSRDFPPGNCALILTTHANEDNFFMYNRVVNWWLSKTPVNIYVVNSSTFPLQLEDHERLTVVSFDQTKVDRRLKNWPEYYKTSLPTLGEALSLAAVSKVMSHEIRDYKYVVKLTGKYILPDLPVALHELPPDFSMAVQKPEDSQCPWRSEVWVTSGKTYQASVTILSLMEDLKNMEARIGIVSALYKASYLPPLEIPEMWRFPRSGHDIRTHL